MKASGAVTGHLRIAVLAERWGSASDAGWYARQVAGALACVADVHVLTPHSDSPGTSSDGVFTVHELGFEGYLHALHRRDLLVDALSGPTVSLDASVTSLLDEEVVSPWEAVVPLLDDLAPDAAVIIGRRSLGAAEALRAARCPLPYTLVPADTAFGPLGTDHFDSVLKGADSVITATDAERAGMIASGAEPERVPVIGPHIAADPSARREPNSWVGDTGAIVVVTGTPADDRSRGDDDNEFPSGFSAPTTASVRELEDNPRLAHMLRLAHPDPPVAIAATDGLTVWHRGRASHGWAVHRASDFARLVAWAGMVVDLSPEPFLARRCLTALAFGTPIVVPAETVAATHAAAGGGLWFASAAELLWTVNAVLDARVRKDLSDQGRAYAAARYGSTESFIDGVARTVLARSCQPSGSSTVVA